MPAPFTHACPRPPPHTSHARPPRTHPQLPWFLTGPTLPAVTQFTMLPTEGVMDGVRVAEGVMEGVRDGEGVMEGVGVRDLDAVRDLVGVLEDVRVLS